MDESAMMNSPETPDTDFEPITPAEVIETLARGQMQEEHGLLPWGSNYAYLVSVTDDVRTLLAVYKPQRGERPLWDFPEGTLCYREVAAFVVSEALGWQLVPPTVLRGGPYGLGSVQFFIHHDPEINYFTPFPPGSEAQLQRFAAFDVLINNADRKGGHCLLDAQGHLWGIDHGVSFHYSHKLRTVIWEFAGMPLPESIVADVAAFSRVLHDAESRLTTVLHDLLADHEVEALRQRADRLLETCIFPEEGPGPNYPWPPV